MERVSEGSMDGRTARRLSGCSRILGRDAAAGLADSGSLSRLTLAGWLRYSCCSSYARPRPALPSQPLHTLCILLRIVTSLAFPCLLRPRLPGSAPAQRCLHKSVSCASACSRSQQRLHHRHHSSQMLELTPMLIQSRPAKSPSSELPRCASKLDLFGSQHGR